MDPLSVHPLLSFMQRPLAEREARWAELPFFVFFFCHDELYFHLCATSYRLYLLSHNYWSRWSSMFYVEALEPLSVI